MTAHLVIEQRLNAKFKPGACSSNINCQITGNRRGNHSSWRVGNRIETDGLINVIPREGQHESHVETVRTDSGNATVPEKEGLNHQGDGD